MLWGGRGQRTLAWVVKGKENFAGPDANAATVAHCARGGQVMRHTTKESPRSRKLQPHGSSYIPNPDGGECSRQRVIFLYFSRLFDWKRSGSLIDLRSTLITSCSALSAAGLHCLHLGPHMFPQALRIVAV